MDDQVAIEHPQLLQSTVALLAHLSEVGNHLKHGPEIYHHQHGQFAERVASLHQYLVAVLHLTRSRLYMPCWVQERTDGRHGGGILLDVLVGTERIFAGISLLEVPAVVDVFTKTGQARLYSDLMHPEADAPVSPEAAAIGIKHQGRVPDEAPYMLLQLGEDARRRARMFFEEIYPENAWP